MKTAKRRTAEAVLALLCLSATALAAPAAVKPEYSFQLQSSVKEITELKDGILGAGLNAEHAGRAGLNEITLTAPGYGSRRIRFWIDDNVKKQVFVELTKSRSTAEPNWSTPLKKFAPDKLSKRASACVFYQSKAQEKQFCDRVTFIDDIFYADESVFRQSDLRVYSSRDELNTFRKLLAQVGSPAATPGIEDFYSIHPGEISALHLLSLHSLLTGDCPRVASVYVDAAQVLEESSELRLHMAICADMGNNIKLRDQILAEGIKAPKPEASLLHWAFGVQLPTSVPKALELATLCGKARGRDLRCQDAMGMVSRIQGKTYRVTGLNIEEATFKSFLDVEGNLGKGSPDALYVEAATNLETYPLSLEYYLLLSWINAVTSKDVASDAYLAGRMQVATQLGGSTIEKIVEAMEKQNLTELLPPVYLRRLRFYPEDPNLWYRLIRSFAKAKQCKELLGAVDRGKAYLPKYNSSLLQMQGSCEVDLGRFNLALKTYGKIMEVNPNVWSSPYNLANVYDRLGKRAEALDYFKKTANLKPPPSVGEVVQAKIKYFSLPIRNR